MESFVDNCSRILVEKFNEFAQKEEVINMGHWMQCYAFDVSTLNYCFSFYIDVAQVIGEITVGFNPSKERYRFEEILNSLYRLLKDSASSTKAKILLTS